MAFYDLPKDERKELVEEINQIILSDLSSSKFDRILDFFSDEDTYIRKVGY